MAVTRGKTNSAGRASNLMVDLRIDAARQAILAVEPTLLVHAAAVLPLSFTGPDSQAAADQNLAMDEVILRVARDARCPVIYFSGTSLYGCVQERCDESSPIYPRGAYLEAKRRTEETVLALGTGGTVLRVSSPYGIHQRSQTVLLKFIRQALRGETLRYFGTGNREQDFIAVEDVAAAMSAVVSSGVRGTFNVASGQPTTMKELATAVNEAIRGNSSDAIPAGVVDEQENCRARFSIAKAQRELSWRPSIDLRTGIKNIASSLAP